MIQYNKHAFKFKIDGETPCSSTHSAQSQAIIRLSTKVDNPLLGYVQKVGVLRVASINQKCRWYFKSVGLVNVEEHETHKYIVDQMKIFTAKAQESNHRCQCANNDKRGFVHSLILSIWDHENDDATMKTTTITTIKCKIEASCINIDGLYTLEGTVYIKQREIMEGKGKAIGLNQSQG